VLADWASNPYVIWRAVVSHYPFYTLSYPLADYQSIRKLLLPRLLAFNVDLYLAGHEHLLAYGEITSAELTHEQWFFSLDPVDTCPENIETWFGGSVERRHTVVQGNLWQVTVGNTAWPQYNICTDREFDIEFRYAENKYWAWTQIQATNTTLQVMSRGVTNSTSLVTELYSLTISRVPLPDSDDGMPAPEWHTILIYSVLLVCLIILRGMYKYKERVMRVYRISRAPIVDTELMTVKN
jgi:hypothetical protein